MKTLGVIGSRDFNDYNLLKAILNNECPDVIVSGGALGTDSNARRFAQENNIKFIEYLPDYDKFGRGAPLLRNKLIVNDSDCILAFWDGLSAGTRFTIDFAQKQGKPVKVIDTSLKFNRSNLLGEPSDRSSAWSKYLDSQRFEQGSASMLKAAKKAASIISNPADRLQYSYLYTKSVFKPSKYSSLKGKDNLYFVMPSSSGNQFPYALATILKENFGGEIIADYADQVHKGHVKGLFGVSKVVASRSYEITERFKKNIDSYKNKTIVLVDDLISTGVTIDSLRFELCKAGLNVDYVCSLINTSSSLSTQKNINNLAKMVYKNSELPECQTMMNSVLHNTPGNIIFHLHRGIKNDSDRSIVKDFVYHKYSEYVDCLYKSGYFYLRELKTSADISDHINKKFDVSLSPSLISFLDSALDLNSISIYDLYSKVNTSILDFVSKDYAWKSIDDLSNNGLMCYSSNDDKDSKYYIGRDNSDYTAFKNCSGTNYILGKDPSISSIQWQIETYAVNSHIKTDLQCLLDKKNSIQLTMDL